MPNTNHARDQPWLFVCQSSKKDYVNHIIILTKKGNAK